MPSVSGIFSSGPAVYAQGGVSREVCFAVADDGDRLHVVNRFSGADSPAPNLTGVTDIEAVELSIDTNLLYAINDDTDAGGTGVFGAIDQITGLFTPIGSIGTASHTLLGSRNLGDGDSLAVEPRTNQFWAVEQTGGELNNAIYRINPATGSHVPDVFGAGNAYAIIDLRPANLPSCSGAGPTCTPGVNCPDTIDDLAINPNTGDAFAIANSIGVPTADWLIRLNLDTTDPANSSGYDAATGYLSACMVGIINDGTANVTDMEGLGVYNDGSFYSTTGSNSLIESQADTLWALDINTAQVTAVGQFPTDSDYESVACLTGGGNLITGTVFCEMPGATNGTLDPGDTLQPGATIRLWLDRGAYKVLDGDDILLQTYITGSGGTYSFDVGSTDAFVIEMDDGIIPLGSRYTTPLSEGNVHEALFLDYMLNSADINNNFGFICGSAATNSDLAITITDAPDPVTPGENLTYTIEVTNVTEVVAVNGVMTNPLPAGTTFVSLDAPAGWTCTTPAVGSGGTVTCTAPSVAPGGPYTFTLVVTVDAGYTTPDPIPDTATVDADNDNNPANNSAAAFTGLVTGQETPVPTDEPTATPVPGEPTSTPQTPIDTSGTPVPTSIPGQVSLTDPALSKSGVLTRGGFGLPGEQVTWVITARNTNSFPLESVVVTDTLRSDLRIDDVSTAVGTFSISGQTVTFQLGTLAPGAQVEMRIVTTIMVSPRLPITNTAYLTESAGRRLSASAEVLGSGDSGEAAGFPLRLPDTGYPPRQ